MDETNPRYRSRRPFPSLRAFFDHTQFRQSDVAADLGISESHLCNIVSGKRTPSLKLAKALSRIANVPIEAIGVEFASR